MEMLQTIALSKTYGSGSTAIHALKSTDITINKGEFVALVGPSGSGKSTLLHLLGGLDKPTSGKVIISGKNIFSLSENELSIFRRRKIGFIFQFYNLIPVLSAEENIILPLLFDNKTVDQNYIEELLEALGLRNRRNHLPNALSGGEQQRVAIARALANKPLIIFADEPTGNLDIRTGDEVLNLMSISIKKYNQTLIMITHSPDIAAKANRTIAIQDGIIVKAKDG